MKKYLLHSMKYGATREQQFYVSMETLFCKVPFCMIASCSARILRQNAVYLLSFIQIF